MAEDTRPDELEGWGVRWRMALVWIGVVLGVFWLSVGGAYWLYRARGAPAVNVRSEALFPEPRLNGRLDRDPHFSFAPPNPAETGPEPQIARAMAELAARGDAGYAPLGPQPPGPPATLGRRP